MTVSANWDNEQKTIIRYSFDGNWTWNEFYAAVNQSHALQDAVSHRVDIILDLGESYVVPEGALMQFRRLAGINHANTGVRVIVSRNSTLGVLFDTFTRVYSKIAEKHYLASSMEQAYAIISQVRTE